MLTIRFISSYSFPEQAASLKDEGNAFFKEKNYEKAILSYTAGLKKKCGDQELDTVLLTNRAAAHFHLGKDLLFTCRTDTYGYGLLRMNPIRWFTKNTFKLFIVICTTITVPPTVPIEYVLDVDTDQVKQGPP